VVIAAIVADMDSDEHDTEMSGCSDEEEAPRAQNSRRTNVPEPFTDAQKAAHRQMEGAMRPLQKLTLQTEGDKPVADMETIYVKTAIQTLKKPTIKVPRSDAGAGLTRKTDRVVWEDCDISVQEFRRIVVDQLETRILKLPPVAPLCVLMFLNPGINKQTLLGGDHLLHARRCFDDAWEKAADKFEEHQPAAQQQSPSKQRRRSNRSEDSDDDSNMFMHVDDDGDGAADANANRPRRHNASAEKAELLAMRSDEYARFRIQDGVRGCRIDLLKMYADPAIRSKYPAATMLFESKGAVQVTEAHEERVFRFAKLTKNPLRTRLSPALLEACVIIRQNIPVWGAARRRPRLRPHLVDLQVHEKHNRRTQPSGRRDVRRRRVRARLRRMKVRRRRRGRRELAASQVSAHRRIGASAPARPGVALAARTRPDVRGRTSRSNARGPTFFFAAHDPTSLSLHARGVTSRSSPAEFAARYCLSRGGRRVRVQLGPEARGTRL